MDFPLEPERVAGGDTTIRLTPAKISVRFVRFLLFESSGTAPPGAIDPRDHLGFSMREIYLGSTDSKGDFHDLMRHAPSGSKQTVTYVSSTDPWHRATDLDPDTEQPGIDRVYQSGLTADQPMILPVGVLYDTPENAAAMLRYVRTRGYPLQQIEVGEEPDGQQVSPEHYGDLYLIFADALHAIDPTLALGGPGFEQGIAEVWPEADGDRNFLRRFAGFLRSRHRLADLSFVSFEHYPFDNLCDPASEQLLQAPAKLDAALASLALADLQPSIPLIITEYGFSAFAGRTMIELPSALLNADIVGQFLTAGGRTAYFYGAEPNTPINELNRCAGYGNMMLYEADRSGNAKWPMPTFFGAQLMTQQWVEPSDKVHRLYPAETSVRDSGGRQIVTAYAVLRPDGQWALMLINKDAKAAHRVTIEFDDGHGAVPKAMRGPVQIYQYGPAQYRWGADGESGHPLRSDAPRSFIADAQGALDLPAYSMTIVRGQGPTP